MDLNNTFNQNRFEEYVFHLKDSGLSDTSLKRKLSSLASFQRFLVRRKYITKTVSVNDKKPTFSAFKNLFPFKKKRVS